jgi:hypothetical protein
VVSAGAVLTILSGGKPATGRRRRQAATSAVAPP